MTSAAMLIDSATFGEGEGVACRSAAARQQCKEQREASQQ